MAEKIRIGALISGGGSNLQAIIDGCEAGKIDGKVVFVGSDVPKAKGLKRAENHNIPTFNVDYSWIIMTYDRGGAIEPPVDFDFDEIFQKQNIFPDSATTDVINRFLVTRAFAEFRLLENMKQYSFDLLVLAGFMRNLTPYFIDRVNIDLERPRIMNIHPALLPSFPGTDGYGDTLRYGCKIGGCTVHFVDYGEDTGPIIGQESYKIHPDDTEGSIKKKGLILEWQLYSECIQFFAEDRLRVVKKEYTKKDGTKYKRKIVEILPEGR